MSLITKENIEIWMFNYHEELLSASEKEQLLHFLIENPIYNEDFMLWANAHITPPKTQAVTADITQNLLQKEGPLYAFPTKTITSFVGGICFACICMYIMRSVNTDVDNIKALNTTQELKKNPDHENPSPLKNTPAKHETVVPPNPAYISPKGINSIKNEIIPKSIVPEKDIANINRDVVQKDSLAKTLTVTNNKDSIFVSQSNNEQRISIQPETKTSVSEENKTSKSKKNKFSLKPAKEFNVENPNF